MPVNRNTDVPATLADAERQIERLQEELLSLQRLAIMGETSAMVAHEYNNLMTPVLALAQEALSRGSPELMAKALQKTINQVGKATTLCARLIGAARTDAAHDPGGADAGASIRDAAEEALAMLGRPLDRDGIEWNVSVAGDPRVKAHPVLLQQVLLNLILNARKAMIGKRGRLALSVSREQGRVLIELKDSGTGLDPQRLLAINEFLASDQSRRPRDGEGIGLGLAVCRMIATEHQAGIQFAANAGGTGCTVRIDWPAA